MVYCFVVDTKTAICSIRFSAIFPALKTTVPRRQRLNKDESNDENTLSLGLATGTHSVCVVLLMPRTLELGTTISN